MSALGHKRTCAAQKVMSALAPKADMCRATRDVRFVPIADIDRQFEAPVPSSDPLVSGRPDRRYREHIIEQLIDFVVR